MGVLLNGGGGGGDCGTLSSAFHISSGRPLKLLLPLPPPLLLLLLLLNVEAALESITLGWSKLTTPPAKDDATAEAVRVRRREMYSQAC